MYWKNKSSIGTKKSKTHILTGIFLFKKKKKKQQSKSHYTQNTKHMRCSLSHGRTHNIFETLLLGRQKILRGQFGNLRAKNERFSLDRQTLVVTFYQVWREDKEFTRMRKHQNSSLCFYCLFCLHALFAPFSLSMSLSLSLFLCLCKCFIDFY